MHPLESLQISRRPLSTEHPLTPSALPDLDRFRAVLFDLDGVLTPTAELHMQAWKTMFTELFHEKGVEAPYTDDDYFDHLDGKQRVDGVQALLESRDIRLPRGEADDGPDVDTVNGVGNRKNIVFSELLERDGIAPYAGSLALLDQLGAAGVPMGIVSSSKNATWVLTAAGLIERFPVIVDGLVSVDEGLASKPAPDMFLYGARVLDIPPADIVVFEDATSGVAAAHAGHFGLVVGVDRGTGAQSLIESGADVVIDDLAEFVRPAGPTPS